MTTTHDTAKKDDGQAAVPESATLNEDVVVTLYPDELSVRRGSVDKIYDFHARRLFIVDDEKKSITSHSLYAYPVAKANKKHNRQAQNQNLGADKQSIAALSKTQQSDVDIDMEFGSVSDTKTSGEIKQTAADGETILTAEGKELAHFKLSETAIPEPLKASYAKFVLYETMLHPAIQKSLTAENKAFGALHYAVKDRDWEAETDWTLTGTDKTGEASVVLPKNYAEIFSSNPLIDAAVKKSISDPKPTQQAYEAKIKAFLDKKDFLRAALASFEMTIILPPDVVKQSPVFKQAQEEGVKDQFTEQTMADITRKPRTDDEFDIMVQGLSAAEITAPDYTYLLDVYEANHVMAWLAADRTAFVGETRTVGDVTHRLETAIIDNPWLAGVYHDLGGIYASNGQMEQAWDYWDQAVRISPDHPTVKAILDMQQAVAKDFPEYF